MDSEMEKGLKQPLQLCFLALINWGLFYGLSVFLARTLGTRGFHDYSVAVATIVLLTSLTTLAFEKYALRILPAAFETGDWSVARGFVRFSIRSTIVVSVLVGMAYLLVRVLATGGSAKDSWPLLVGVAAVPVVALSLLFIEFLASSGKVVRATFFYRLLLPIAAASFIIGTGLYAGNLTATQAVLGYAGAWVVTLGVLWRQTWKWVPMELKSVAAIARPREWIKSSAPFLVHSVMMTQFASLGIIGLEFAGRGERSVAILAACMQTGSFVVLLATATNRFYSPLVSVLIEKQDFASIEKHIKERWQWIVPVTLAYFLGIVFFGKRILGLFGPDFQSGYPALVWIAAGASISVILSMAPTYLKFVRRNGTVLAITALAAAVNFGLILFLGPEYGATGAAVAYGVSVGGMAIAFAVLGIYGVRRRLAKGLSPGDQVV